MSDIRILCARIFLLHVSASCVLISVCNSNVQLCMRIQRRIIRNISFPFYNFEWIEQITFCMESMTDLLTDWLNDVLFTCARRYDMMANFFIFHQISLNAFRICILHTNFDYTSRNLLKCVRAFSATKQKLVVARICELWELCEERRRDMHEHVKVALAQYTI